MDTPDPHYIENLEKELYSQNYKAPEQSHTRLDEPAGVRDVRQSWLHRPRPEGPKPLGDSFLKKIFIFAVVFFLVCVGVAAAVFFWGLNTISTDKVDIAFQGPISIAAGTELDFTISINNSNNTPLLNPVLNVTFPDGTKEASDLSVDYPRDQENLATIDVNGTSQTPFKAVLFGAAQANETIKAVLQYQVKGSNTLFTKETDYQVTISSSPVSVNVTAPQNIISGQSVTLGVTVTSNSTAPLQNLLFTAQYPFGFTVSTTTPTTTISNDTWAIPVLAPGQQTSFQISGVVTGQNGDQPTFHFNVGLASSTSQNQMSVNYLSTVQSLSIQQPPLATSLSFDTGGTNGSTIVVSQGSPITGDVTVTNNSTIQLSNISANAVFSGPLLDPTSPSSNQGFYQSSNQSIIWNSTNDSSLQTLAPGQSVTLNFTFSSLSQSQAAAFNNGTMSVQVSATGQETTAGTNSQITSNTANGTVQIGSVATIAARAVYSTGPFQNTGPIPPQVNVPTTYTIIWDISNSSDALADAEVRATLPAYMTWVGAISPSSENVTYDSLANQIVWRAGDVAVGTGQTSPLREVAFQVKMLPSTSQLASSPALINNTTLQAVDTFTNQDLVANAGAVTTALATDPGVSKTGWQVIQ